ncbi:hypothetical protein VZT92_000559 [Zoarces viviparus]|uniref:1-alkyl-2-acetylglycerophosphocholine esterase n=1 Tax=Zoarces viviparus TaxID=48416 RepID=A0AAW1G7D1_ZOAVI
MNFQVVRESQLSSKSLDYFVQGPAQRITSGQVLQHPLATIALAKIKRAFADVSLSLKRSPDSTSPERKMTRDTTSLKRPYGEICQDIKLIPEISCPVMKKRKIMEGRPLLKKTFGEICQDIKLIPEISCPVMKKRKIMEGTPLLKKTFGEICQDIKLIPEISCPVMKKRKIMEGTPPVESSSGHCSQGRKIFPRISFPDLSSESSPKKKVDMKSKARPKIWIIGSSYVRRGEEGAYQNFGENFGLNAKVEWFGKGGRRWSGVLPSFYAELKTQSPPDILVIHAGGNDLGLSPAKELASRITKDLIQLHAKFPQMKIAYSCINERQAWRYGQPGKVNFDRKIVNNSIRKAVSNCDIEVIEHPHLRYNNWKIFAADGVHFTKEGNGIFVSSIHSVLKKILQKHQTPSCALGV